MDMISSPQWLPDFKTGACLAGSTAYSIPSTELLIEKIECCRRYFDSQTAQTCMNDLPSPSICKCLDCKEDEVCGYWISNSTIRQPPRDKASTAFMSYPNVASAATVEVLPKDGKRDLIPVLSLS
eukprot:scaffold13344_cov215-Alexandrium_tamarense.AAC.6